jgi:hypothetical protein
LQISDRQLKYDAHLLMIKIVTSVHGEREARPTRGARARDVRASWPLKYSSIVHPMQLDYYSGPLD